MALELGVIDVQGMLIGMTASQLEDWAAYFHENGFWRDNQQFMFGQFCALFFNANRGKNQRPVMPEDFYPRAKPKPEQSTKSMIRVIKSFFGRK